jgi:hypothetical protein
MQCGVQAEHELPEMTGVSTVGTPLEAALFPRKPVKIGKFRGNCRAWPGSFIRNPAIGDSAFSRKRQDVARATLTDLGHSVAAFCVHMTETFNNVSSS